MDIFAWLEGNGGVLDASIIVRLLFVGLIFELFGLMSHWIRRI